MFARSMPTSRRTSWCALTAFALFVAPYVARAQDAALDAQVPNAPRGSEPAPVEPTNEHSEPDASQASRQLRAPAAKPTPLDAGLGAANGAPEPAAESPLTLLSLAEEAMTTLEYQRGRELAQRAIGHGGLGREEIARAYALIAVSSAQLDDTAAAQHAFVRLFALRPESNVATRLAPARRSAVLDARGFWSVHPDGFGLDVSYARRERQLLVRVRDPINWVHTVHVWSRFGERSYTKATQASASELAFDIDEIQPIDPLEVYVFALDARGNVLMQVGKEHDPQLLAPSEQELAAILRRDIRGGQTGSYARRLQELGVQVALHGYISLEFKQQGEHDTPTFDLHHATAYLRADLGRATSVELALEWEHLGRAEGTFYLPHAFLDLKASDMLVLRAGFFEVPVGAFNEYLYPDFLRVTGLPPLFSQSVVPALWSEVGLQLRGRFEVGRTGYLTYAAFVGNGLEQPDTMPKDGMVAEGGDIREMRFHDRDNFSGDKAVGGRLGLEIGDFDVGLSGYTGRYAIERERRLSMADMDFSFRSEWLIVRSEGAVALQETTLSLLHKYGLYGLIALRPSPYIQPYVQYDFLDLGTRLQRGLLGFALYPLPHERATRSLRLKTEAGFEFPQGQDYVLVWFLQLTTGF